MKNSTEYAVMGINGFGWQWHWHFVRVCPIPAISLLNPRRKFYSQSMANLLDVDLKTVPALLESPQKLTFATANFFVLKFS